MGSLKSSKLEWWLVFTVNFTNKTMKTYTPRSWILHFFSACSTNFSNHGMVYTSRQLQSSFYQRRYRHTAIHCVPTQRSEQTKEEVIHVTQVILRTKTTSSPLVYKFERISYQRHELQAT